MEKRGIGLFYAPVLKTASAEPITGTAREIIKFILGLRESARPWKIPKFTR
jgi:hypothetical protein